MYSDESVRVACMSMVTDAWLSTHNGDMLQLLTSLDCDTYSSDMERIIRVLIDHRIGLDTTPLPPYASDTLTPERALYWRILCESFAASTKHQSLLDRYVPDTVEICALVQAHSPNAAIATELMKLCLHAELGDEAGRRGLTNLLITLIRDDMTPAAVLPPILRVLRRLHGARDEAAYIRVILELLADIRDPLESHETDEARAQRKQHEERFVALQQLLDDAKVQRQVYIQQDQDEEAEGMRLRMDEIANELEGVEKILSNAVNQDEGTWLRMLCVVSHVMQHTSFNLQHPGIAGLLETTIIPAMQLESLPVRAAAVKCIGYHWYAFYRLFFL
jgi:hypothetical protein